MTTAQRRYLVGTKLTERRNEDGSDQLPAITGTAAVFFNRSDMAATEFRLGVNIVERIHPGAFDAIAEQDVRALQNHDPRLILGRSSAGTLRLTINERGLHYHIDTPDTAAGRDTVVSIRRGDLDGSSFAFLPAERPEWTEERRGGPGDLSGLRGNQCRHTITGLDVVRFVRTGIPRV